MSGDAPQPPPAPVLSMSESASLLRVFFEWISTPNDKGITPIGVKAIAAGWVINHELFSDADVHNISSKSGINYRQFTKYAAEFRQRFSILQPQKEQCDATKTQT